MKGDKWELQDRKKLSPDLIDKQQMHLTEENIEGQIKLNVIQMKKKILNVVMNYIMKVIKII